jgi:hypothetical protein
MNKTRKNPAGSMTRTMVVFIAMALCFSMAPGFRTKAHANNGAAFLGGILAAHVVGGAIRRDQVRTAAAVQEANQPAPVPAQPTVTQKINQLDKLAAGGYITPEEYKSRKKALLDSM